MAALGSCSLLPVSPHPSSVTKLDTLVIPGLNSKETISWVVPGSKEERGGHGYVLCLPGYHAKAHVWKASLAAARYSHGEETGA